ncbi:chemotaxis response regulator protein-glutamate methylesterase [Herbivorax sp. ANBcel31]|uniref:protein-glutamate methylesterase/protein-glutamine glutaminase n=1 Tax=Herbivorax sp. ANBcel31 TaxID=3069754 RepID=UPI0027B64F7B|nr:chemotaxis response regulator protein-glutamate methylesterase [Herbivorax sp. ANBcel31]MDQ2085873.1 chemotaxis response regulator protein-glutamate methylesterase [Herbivorax sp. ANBcel31]
MKRLNKKVKVMIVDDSAFMRKVIRDILSSDDEIEVIDTAKNGLDAIKKAKVLNPDVVTLDINMPVMDGLLCLKELNRLLKVSVIMLSSVSKEGAEATIKALDDGAIDFITKPSNIFHMSGEEKKNEIVQKIKIAGRALDNYDSNKEKFLIDEDLVKEKTELKYIVAIGTSTGGPKALQKLISSIHPNVEAAFLVVQHMPPGFTKSLADRIDYISKVKVKEAEDNEVIKGSHVYIAPGDSHLMVSKSSENVLKIKLSKDPPVNGHRPSVDVMMKSLSNTNFKNIIGVIMTGMGRDGSEGVEILKNTNNAHIIAQDKKSCIVFGMPKEAILKGVVDVVAALDEIANEIMKTMGVHK